MVRLALIGCGNNAAKYAAANYSDIVQHLQNIEFTATAHAAVDSGRIGKPVPVV